MRGGPTYDTAKGQPRTLNGPDFLAENPKSPLPPMVKRQNGDSFSLLSRSVVLANAVKKVCPHPHNGSNNADSRKDVPFWVSLILLPI